MEKEGTSQMDESLEGMEGLELPCWNLALDGQRREWMDRWTMEWKEGRRWPVDRLVMPWHRKSEEVAAVNGSWGKTPKPGRGEPIRKSGD